MAGVRARDRRTVRLHRQRERDNLTATAKTAPPGITLRHGTLSGYVTDGCRCNVCRRCMRDWKRARRERIYGATRHLSAAAQVRAAVLREKELASAKSQATPELLELIRDQEKDSYFIIHQRPWIVSLDAPWGWSDGTADHYESGGIVAYTARRRGDFSTDAPWVMPLIERLDAERALQAMAA